MLQPKRNEKSPLWVEGGHKEPESGEEHTAWKDDLAWSSELRCGVNGCAVRQQGAGVRVKWDEGIHIREGMVMEDHLHVVGSIK